MNSLRIQRLKNTSVNSYAPFTFSNYSGHIERAWEAVMHLSPLPGHGGILDGEPREFGGQFLLNLARETPEHGDLIQPFGFDPGPRI